MFKLSRSLKLRPSFSCFKGRYVMPAKASSSALAPAPAPADNTTVTVSEQHRSSFSRTLKTLLGLSVGVTLSLSSPMALAEQSATANAANTEQQISVFTYHGAREETTIMVPHQPQRIAVIDYAILDIIDRLGLSSKIVGTAKGVAPEYLQHLTTDPDIENLGTVKAVDLERLMALEPEVIFIGGRLAAQYDQLSRIAPVVFLAVDYKQPLLQSVKRNTDVIASIFDQQHQADALLQSFAQRIATVKEKAQGSSVLVGMVNASQFKTLGDQGRCAFIGQDLGFNNIAGNLSSNHGNESSFELLLQLNPEYLFVLDRDSAIGRNGAQLARDVMNNELVHKTKAYQQDHIFYLNSAVWYLSEGGLSAMDLMLQDIEQALKLQPQQ